MPKLSENFNNQYSGNLKCDPSCTHTHTHERRGAHTNNKTRKKKNTIWMIQPNRSIVSFIYTYICTRKMHAHMLETCNHQNLKWPSEINGFYLKGTKPGSELYLI